MVAGGCALVALAVGTARAGPDLLLTDRLNSNVLRFAGDTGAYVSEFITGFDPIGIECGPDGYIYVADQDALEVKKFDSNGTYVSKVKEPWRFLVAKTPSETVYVFLNSKIVLIRCWA